MKPNGEKILGLLIQLLADQEGVKVTYDIEDRKDEE
jgi:hypothetical protein